MPEQPPEEDATVHDDLVQDAPVRQPAPVADESLLAAHELARVALLEITPESTVGPVAGHVVEGDHVLSLLFECTLPGYPGWHWTVTVARVDGGAEPVVLEAELLPGEKALLAPDWVPWSERLAEYQAAQEAARAAGEADDEASDAQSEDDADDLDEELDEDDDLDADDDIDGIGAGLKRGRYPDTAHGRKIAAVLRRVADDLDA